MNISAPFIARPVATILLTIGVILAGAVAFSLLPVAPQPQVDLPTISVSASMSGASPEIVATSVATPLERHLGAIADVTEMTSSSSVGNVRITLQFGLNRDIDGAARDVEAAINAARIDMPAGLRSNPTYRKVNPSEQPLLIYSLTSKTLTPGQIYDRASTVIQQRLSQVEGVGDVQISGSALPAVRAELNPRALFKYGIGLEDVRAALQTANANTPKGAIEQDDRHFQIYTNDQSRVAADFASLIIAYRNGAPVRLSDIANVQDSVENIRNLALTNGVPSVLVQVMRQPGANIIQTTDRVLAVMPELQKALPPDLDVKVASDRTTTIRASLHMVEETLVIATTLVILVVFFFLGNWRAAVIPSVAVPVSLLGTFGFMYLAGFSLNNLTLMAVTIATGFVVDDAIVLLENITRHVESGMPRMQAALTGAREVGFTVVAMSLSLVAVFIPVMFMGGIIGRFFREFGLTLSFSIIVSLVVSLTTTPMLCARLLRPHRPGSSWFAATQETWFGDVLRGYGRSLSWVLRHGALAMLVLLVVICLNVYLYIAIPKNLFPSEDSGRLMGFIRGDQSISFQSMRDKITRFVQIIQQDPDVEIVSGSTGGGQTNGGNIFATLKPVAERKIPGTTSDQIASRLRPKLNIPGAMAFLNVGQEFRVGGRQSNATYQYTLQGDDVGEIRSWTLKLVEALKELPEMTDVNSDQDVKGLETRLVVDRATASRLGLTMSQISNTLYDAFGQRAVSTIFNPMNQYRVIMEVSPEFWQSPETLKEVYVSSSGGSVSSTASTNAIASTVSIPTSSFGSAAVTDPLQAQAAQDQAIAVQNQQTNALVTGGKGVSTGSAVSTRVARMVPLSEVAHYEMGETPLAVNHQGTFVAATVSFNVADGVSLSQATRALETTMNRIGVPTSIQGGFAGTARTFQVSIGNEPAQILSAIIAIYIVLGVLYESYIHPITILSTLPSAGVGALLALLVSRLDFSIIALIAIFLLIGIVKKNAIMMIDFAIDGERHGLSPRDAIHNAAMLRFRPIMMTTMAAILGAFPLAVAGGEGTEMRRPLGIAVVGGLIVSQVLTLYTTPVVYLYMERFRMWLHKAWHGDKKLPAGARA